MLKLVQAQTGIYVSNGEDMAAESTEVFSLLVKAVEIGVIPIVGYGVKKLTEISNELIELRTALIGIDGKNGIRSRLIHLERKFEAFAERKPEQYSRRTDTFEIG